MATGDPVVYLDFTGGVHIDSGGTYLLKDNQCYDCRNVRSTQHGVLEKREGFSTVSDIAPLDSAHSLAAVNIDGNETLVAVGPDGANDKWLSVPTDGSAGTVVASGLEADTRWSIVQGPQGNLQGTPQGPFYGMNGVDPPLQWTGDPSDTALPWTAWAGDVPEKTTLLTYHLDKFWASGDPDAPGRLYSTGVQDEAEFQTLLPDPCNWDVSYIDDIEPYDGQNITALGKVGPYLLILKERSTYVISDPQGRAVRKISSSVGCTAPRSIAETAAGTMFFSDDVGVVLTDGTNVTVVSEAIEPLLKNVVATYPQGVRNAVGTYWQDSYYLSVPMETSANDVLLEYNLETRAWWIHSVGSNDFAILDPSTAPKLYSLRPGQPLLERAFRPDNYLDSGQPYEAYWRGPFWTWGNPHLNKRISQYRMDGKGTWIVKAAERFEDTYTTLDSVIWEQPGLESISQIFAPAVPDGHIFAPAAPNDDIFAPGVGITQIRYPTPVDGWGRAWSLYISDGESANYFALYSITAFIRSRTD